MLVVSVRLAIVEVFSAMVYRSFPSNVSVKVQMEETQVPLYVTP